MIPVNQPLLNGNELKYVSECIQSSWISSSGRFIDIFEKQWASYCGMKYGIAVSNGTTALQIAVACLDLEPGDEVIIPSFTIISCALAVIYNGGKPVLVDSDPRTWCMDVEQIESKITSRTRAILPVHIYGHPVDMDPVVKLADKYELVVIEDAAEVHGAEYLSGRDNSDPLWKKCGGIGQISTFSFYANKLITTGEGGMVLTNDPAYAEKARSLCNLCFRPERRFYHTESGHNFRLTNLQAAVGLAQVERIEEIVDRKRWMGKSYTERLKDISGLQLPVEEPWARQVYWMYGIVLDESTGITAEDFGRLLLEQSIQTRPFFLGMHEQPVFVKKGLFHRESYPVSERIAAQGLYVPSGMALKESDIDKVCKAVRSIVS